MSSFKLQPSLFSHPSSNCGGNDIDSGSDNNNNDDSAGSNNQNSGVGGDHSEIIIMVKATIYSNAW